MCLIHDILYNILYYQNDAFNIADSDITSDRSKPLMNLVKP